MTRALQINELNEILAHINTIGIDNINTKSTKKYYPHIDYLIRKKYGGYKKLKTDYLLNNVKNLNSKSVVIDNETEKVESNSQEISFPEFKDISLDENENNFEIIEKEIRELKDRFDKFDDIINKIQETVECIANNDRYKEIKEKLDTLTSYQHKNIKEDINEMICKYSYAKYGPNNKYAIMLGNKDIYKEFYKRYKVNIESAQLAFIEFVNNKREETGKSKIIWDSANSLIISKIDIIDKLGLLVEYYFVVKEMCNKILL